MAPNDSSGAAVISYKDASSLLQGMQKSIGLENLAVDNSNLVSILNQVQCSNHSHLPIREAAFDCRNSVPLDSLSLLYAALALCSLRADPKFGSRTYTHQLFETSKQLLGIHTGQASIEVAATLFLLHLIVITTGSTNQGKTFIGQAVQACHELKLNRFKKDSTTIRGTWLYLLVYMADVLVPGVD